MNGDLRLEPLTQGNFGAFEKFDPLLRCDDGGACYCAFAHRRWGEGEWERQKKEAPLANRDLVLAKVKAGAHVGLLVYREGEVAGWVAVGPVSEFVWTVPRAAAAGGGGKSVAGIVCIAIARPLRGQGLLGRILALLPDYGRDRGWSSIEAYPFDETALAAHPGALGWPGYVGAYRKAGFTRQGPHWSPTPGFERSIYALRLR